MSRSVGNNFAALREDSNLGVHINFSKDLSSNELMLKNIERTLSSKIAKDGVRVWSKLYDAGKDDKFATLKLLPEIDGVRIDKVIDTKAEVERIIKGALNDLVITAGDGSNDVRMLDLFEYICDKNSDPIQTFNAQNLKKIYDLPAISIFVGNAGNGGDKSNKLHGKGLGVKFDEIDSYFNSDGNIRFIHIDPTNPLKPQNLQEALPIAIKEYAKRNEAFRDNLPKEMQKLIENLDYEYPIDMAVVKKLEDQTGEKLWNPAPALRKKVHEAINANSGGTPQLIKNSKNKIIAGTVAGIALLGFGIYLYKKLKNKKLQAVIQPQQSNILISNKTNMTLPEVFKDFKAA